MEHVLLSTRGCAFLLLTFCARLGVSSAQTTFQMAYRFSQFSSAAAYSARQTPDGGYIAVGYAYISGYKVVVIKTDSTGDKLWSRLYGVSGIDEGHSIQQTSDGGYIVVGGGGSYGPYSTLPKDVYLIKINSSGDTLWTRTYGRSYDDQGWSVQETPDDGYIVSGTTALSPGDNHVYLIKTNSSGDTLWTRTYGSMGSGWGCLVQQTSDGGYIFAAANCRTPDNPLSIYVIKTDSSGDTLWTKACGTTDSAQVHSFQPTSDGGYILAGTILESYTGLSDVYLVKMTSSGDTLWTRRYGDPYNESGWSVQETSDGGYIIAGTTVWYGPTEDWPRVWLIKTNSTGDTLWTRQYKGAGQAAGYSVQQTSDGGYVIAGSTYNYSGVTGSEAYLIKTRPDGLLDPPPAPSLSEPSDGAKGVSISLKLGWIWCEQAKSFRLQVALDSLFTELVVDDSTMQSNVKLVYGLSYNTRYYWQVNAKNEYGVSAYSAVWTFTTVVAAPLLVAPLNGATNLSTTLTLVWNASAGATQYRLQLGVDSTFGLGLVLDDSTMVDTLRTVGGLAMSTRFFWRAKAMNTEGVSSWSQVWEFETALALPVPVELVSPVDKAIVGKDGIRFIWRAGWPGVQRYRWELATDSIFRNPTIDSSVTDTFKVVRALNGGQRYWWKVAAKNASGWGVFSLSNRFTTLLTGLSEPGEIPREFSLSQNYPNPFNPNTTIGYGLPQQSHVTLTVFNILGQKVVQLVNGEMDAGYHAVPLDGSTMASGVYMYRIQVRPLGLLTGRESGHGADIFIAVKRLHLLR